MTISTADLGLPELMPLKLCVSAAKMSTRERLMYVALRCLCHSLVPISRRRRCYLRSVLVHEGVLIGTIVAVIARASVILADTIVIGVTWARMHHQIKHVFDLKVRMKTGMVMLADGA